MKMELGTRSTSVVPHDGKEDEGARWESTDLYPTNMVGNFMLNYIMLIHYDLRNAYSLNYLVTRLLPR